MAQKIEYQPLHYGCFPIVVGGTKSITSFSEKIVAVYVGSVVSLLLLSGVLVKETRKYLWNKNLDGVFDDDLPVINK